MSTAAGRSAGDDGPDFAAAAGRGDALPQASDAVEPADALGEVWNLLDALPRAAASPSMTATTIEMAAVEAERSAGSIAALPPSVAGRRGAASTPRSRPVGRRTLAAAALVAGSLVAGIVAGRATAPNTDHRRTLEYLPVVQNLDLLREAGSVGFLEAVATRRFPPPRRPSFPRPAADMRRFEAAVDSLRSFRGDIQADAETIDGRRAEVMTLEGAERRELERSAATFAGLTAEKRRELVRLAEAFGDPRRGDLIEAAFFWHLWILSCDPADRKDIIELESPGRLEWLERQTRIDRRMEERLDGRPPRGWWDRQRPPPGPDPRDRDWPPPGPPNGPPRQGPPSFEGPAAGGPGPARLDGPPRPRRPPDRRPPSTGPGSSDEPDDPVGAATPGFSSGDRSPAETPAPPR